MTKLEGTCTMMDEAFAFFDKTIKNMENIQRVLQELRTTKMESLPLLYERYLGEKPRTLNRKHLEMAIAYTLMARDAVHLWGDEHEAGKEPPKVKLERERAIALCQVSTPNIIKKEKKVSEEKKVINETKPMPENVIVSKGEPQVLKKVAKPLDETSAKLKGMDLAAVIKWAKELGVANVDEIAKRHAGLAKMQLGNAIKNALKK